MEVEWWYWLVAGGLLIAAELLVPAFFVFWFGLSAVGLSLVMLVVPGLPFYVQLLAWAVLSSLLAALWFRFFRREVAPSRQWTAEVFIGERGRLLLAVGKFETGRVRFARPVLGNHEWACTADTALDAGIDVELVSIQGNVAKVTRAKRPSTLA